MAAASVQLSVPGTPVIRPARMSTMTTVNPVESPGGAIPFLAAAATAEAAAVANIEKKNDTIDVTATSAMNPAMIIHRPTERYLHLESTSGATMAVMGIETKSVTLPYCSTKSAKPLGDGALFIVPNKIEAANESRDIPRSSSGNGELEPIRLDFRFG
jgi:hypothetical protein